MRVFIIGKIYDIEIGPYQDSCHENKNSGQQTHPKPLINQEFHSPLYRSPDKTHDFIISTEKQDEIVGEYMKNLCASLLLLILATACDAPQRNRLASTVNNGNGLGQPTSGTTGSNPWTTSGTTGSSTGGSTGNTKPPGFENCDITNKYYAAGIGYMGICQSTIDETSVAVSSTISDSARTCMIPTYKDQSGSSTYIGGPQCFAPQAGVVTTGQIPKTRAGFTDKTLNGVMIMKESSLTAYFTCMDAYINFPSSQLCPQGSNTNTYQQNYYPYQIVNCKAMASASMATKCNNFKTDNSYIDIRLK